MAAKKKAEQVSGALLPFMCPKCGAKPHTHGKGGSKNCRYLDGREGNDCEGIICECDNLVTDGDDEAISAVDQEDHGQSFTNLCEAANCYHCGWGGTLPQKPKGLQAWEKKALEAGWSMPDSRRKELGL